jgi:hypothetical protein
MRDHPFTEKSENPAEQDGAHDNSGGLQDAVIT